MFKIMIFLTGTSAGFYLCKIPSADRIVCAIFAAILILLFILGYLFHLGVSDFQEFEP